MLNDPEKLAAANLSQITTAMGTLIDKWAMIGGSPADTGEGRCAQSEPKGNGKGA